mgnify:CR=1 FL=1
MKRMTKVLGIVLPVGLMLASCSQSLEIGDQTEGTQGQLSFKLDSKTDFIVNTRALQESSYKNVDNYTVVVTDNLILNHIFIMLFAFIRNMIYSFQSI